jgi:hypothetical protein
MSPRQKNFEGSEPEQYDSDEKEQESTALTFGIESSLDRTSGLSFGNSLADQEVDVFQRP